MAFDAGAPVGGIPQMTKINGNDEKRKITIEMEKQNKRKGKMSAGMDWKGSDRIEMIENVMCVKFYIVNRSGESCI